MPFVTPLANLGLASVTLPTYPAELVDDFRSRVGRRLNVVQNTPLLSGGHMPGYWNPAALKAMGDAGRLQSRIGAEASVASLRDSFLPQMAEYRLGRQRARAAQGLEALGSLLNMQIQQRRLERAARDATLSAVLSFLSRLGLGDVWQI